MMPPDLVGSVGQPASLLSKAMPHTTAQAEPARDARDGSCAKPPAARAHERHYRSASAWRLAANCDGTYIIMRHDDHGHRLVIVPPCGNTWQTAPIKLTSSALQARKYSAGVSAIRTEDQCALHQTGRVARQLRCPFTSEYCGKARMPGQFSGCGRTFGKESRDARTVVSGDA